MTIYSDLAIIGFGYLQEVVILNKQMIVRIHCSPQSSEKDKRGEALSFSCIVNDPVIKNKFQCLDNELQNGSSILVKFAANYLETTGFQSCVTEDDPDHILNISAKLTTISVIYIDGVKDLFPEGEKSFGKIVNF